MTRIAEPTPGAVTLNIPPWPQFDDAERRGLMRALEQGQWWRVAGSEVDAFEREFAGYHGARRALAVTNGTHAVQLAMEMLALRPGDEVLVPAYTFVATSLAVQLAGGVPVPVDVEPDTWNMSAAAVADATTSRTRALMPVHMAGLVADMDALGALASDAGLSLVQDAAHAHGALWRGRRIGELSPISALSFQNGKLMTAGEGGALLLDDDATYERAFVRHSCGRPNGDRHYRHTMSGSNFRMNEFSASVLRAQLGRLHGHTTIRERRWSLLRGLLERIDGVVPQADDPRCDRNPHYMGMFRVPGLSESARNGVVDRLVAAGVPAFAGFRAVHRTAGFWDVGPELTPGLSEAELAERCPVSEALTRDSMWLHHRLLLADEPTVTAVADLVAAEVARA